MKNGPDTVTYLPKKALFPLILIKIFVILLVQFWVWFILFDLFTFS